MPKPDDMASLIRGLGDADPSQREIAATEIFRRGNELVRTVAERWVAEAGLDRTIVLNEAHLPVITAGLAVTPDHFEQIRIANGMPRLADVPPDQDAREFELRFGPDARLDILTTQQPDGGGAIARYLQKLGEGIQQIELLTHDVDSATKLLRKLFGLEPIYPQTRTGADGTRVNFFLVAASQSKKVLIELVEPNDALHQQSGTYRKSKKRLFLPGGSE
jgi:hypothetical protein